MYDCSENLQTFIHFCACGLPLLIRVLLHEFSMRCATISYDRGKGGWWEGAEEKDDCLIIKIVSAQPCIAQSLPIPS